jgi:hypothetical protein
VCVQSVRRAQVCRRWINFDIVRCPTNTHTHKKRYRHLVLHVSVSAPFIRCESKSTCMFFSSAKVHTSLNSLSCVLVFRKAPYFQICTLGCDLSVKAQPVRSTIAPSVLDLVKILKFDQIFFSKKKLASTT